LPLVIKQIVNFKYDVIYCCQYIMLNIIYSNTSLPLIRPIIQFIKTTLQDINVAFVMNRRVHFIIISIELNSKVSINNIIYISEK